MNVEHKDQGSEDDSWSQLNCILQIVKPAHEIESGDVKGKALAEIKQWTTFYAVYSRLKGFSVRNDKIRRDKNNNVCHRRWVCSREGFRDKKWDEMVARKRSQKAVTQIGCKACLSVNYDRESIQWVAIGFVAEHNHELASPSEVQYLQSHRVVPHCMVAQARSMKMAGIRTISILDYISMQCGGRRNLPFTKKDFYNKVCNSSRVIGNEIDSEGALGYLTCLAIRDGNFFCRFNVDEEARLHTLFWSDGTARSDYRAFGEVLAFDTTYRTNAYNKPLMIMVGVNHHFRTTVFGVALLADETAETYRWVLTQFVDCMDGQIPKVVVTDGDQAMRVAITQVFPNAIHRLCAWHMDTNACSNVPNGEFKIQFRKLMYKFYTAEEFEEQWKQVVAENNLQQNPWVSSAYDKSYSWAETYLRGHFVGGMRTTQRCESMNAYMRRFLDSKQLLRDFVSQIDRGIQHIRLVKMEDDFKTKHTEPFIPSKDPLSLYYHKFVTTCTQNIYVMVSKEIEAHNSYTVSSSDYNVGHQVFHLSKFRFGEIRHHVKYYRNNNEISCSCLLLETDGIPCRHIFTVLKHLSIEHLLDSLIRQCWHKDAKSSHQLNVAMPPMNSDLLQPGRFGTLAADFNTLGFYASKYEDTFLQARKQIATLTETFKAVCTLRDGDNVAPTHNFNDHIASTNNVVRDPIPVRTKGREKESNKVRHTDGSRTKQTRKRCRTCKGVGHNKATCNKRNTTMSTPCEEEPILQTTNNLPPNSQVASLEDGFHNETWLNDLLNTYPPGTNDEEQVQISSYSTPSLMLETFNEYIANQTNEFSEDQTLPLSTPTVIGFQENDAYDEEM